MDGLSNTVVRGTRSLETIDPCATPWGPREAADAAR
jgi:hypothetical protein